MSNKTYTVKEIAHMEKVSESLVYDWVKLGYLVIIRTPSMKGQGRIIITESAYEDFKNLFKNGCSESC